MIFNAQTSSEFAFDRCMRLAEISLWTLDEAANVSNVVRARRGRSAGSGFS